MRAGYLRRTSLLYRPPYLLRCAASSVISGIQLANTAYVHSKHASQYPRAHYPHSMLRARATLVCRAAPLPRQRTRLCVL